MNSKKFTISIVVIIFSLVGIIYAALWILPEEKYMQSEYSAWRQQKEYSSQYHKEHEIILLGDSRMKIDLNALELGDNVYNLSLSGSNPVDMYYTMKRYLDAGNTPQKVYIGFAPTHLTFYENYLSRGLFFHYYDSDEAREINQNILKYDGKDYTQETYKYEWRSPAVYLKTLLHSLKGNRKTANEATYKEMVANKGTMTLDGAHPMDRPVKPEETKEQDFKPKEVLDFYMCQLIALCKDRNIPVSIIQLPMGKTGVEILTNTGYMDEYHTYMQSIRDRMNIPVELTIPVLKDEYFADDSHLNKKGQHIFTAEFKKKLR